MIGLLVIVPMLAGAAAALAMQGSKYTRYAAFFAAIISLVLAVMVALGGQQLQTFTWFGAFGYQFAISTATFAINKLFLLLVSAMVTLIFAYSIGYMDVPSEQGRFYFEMCIFAAAMALFTISANLVTMFVAWEMLGVMSYLLIGFRRRDRGTLGSARKSVTVLLMGDVLFVAAIAILFSAFHTLDIRALAAFGDSATMTLGLSLLLVAALTKSAVFPFHEWLADAMDAPTPVSALLHSSTMIKCGVFMVALLLPLYAAAGLLPAILAIGLASAAIAIMNALSEHNIKKILAYSTIEDVSLMLVALGLNLLFAMLVLFVVQTFYKALLFMDVGIMTRASDGDLDMYAIRGIRKNRLLFITTLIGVLSIAGLVPFGGFFGKVGIAGAAAADPYVYVGLMALEVFSSIYLFRFLIVPSRKPPVWENAPLGYKTVPRSMQAGVAIGALLVIGSGLSFFFLPGLLGIAGKTFSASSALIESAALAVGMGAAYFLYVKNHGLKAAPDSTRYRLLHNSFFVNLFYSGFASAVSSVGNAVEEFDSFIGRNVDVAGHGVVLFGRFIGRVDRGNLNVYAAAFALGIIIMLVFFGFGFFGVL